MCRDYAARTVRPTDLGCTRSGEMQPRARAEHPWGMSFHNVVASGGSSESPSRTDGYATIGTTLRSQIVARLTAAGVHDPERETNVLVEAAGADPARLESFVTR